MGLLKKITRPFKKVVQKVVPKEIAGIMQVAAPFTGAAAPFVYAAGALKQRGTLGPRDLLAAATLGLPYAARVGQGQGILGSRFAYSGNLGQFGTLGKDVFTARDLLGLRDATGIRGQAERFLFGRPSVEGGSVFDTEGRCEGTFEGVKPTQGILGAGGDFKLTEGKLLSTMDKKTGEIALSKTKIGAAVAAGLSLTQTQEQIEEEGEEAGLSSSEIARLQSEAAEMWEDFDTTAFRPKVAQGGLMRINLAKGTVNPFKPKPEDFGIEDNEIQEGPKPFTPKPNVGKMAALRGVESLMPEVLEDEILIERDLSKASPESSYNAVDFMIEQFEEKGIAPKILGKGFQGDEEILIIETPRGGSMLITVEDYLKNFSRIDREKGGLMRLNYALGSRPTEQESGLGGLPIEADMRYTGGFMPYGAKEKADDVPARLSKNEFVFTADAVRGAGGGDINTGAKRMYQSMKQLEQMGKRA
jgi:hypothetical protein